MSEKEIKEQMSLRYQQDLENQRLRYENERQQRIRREMDANYRVQQDIREEEQEKLRRKREIMAKQYNEYLKGQEYKHEKMLKEVQEKLEPTLVSLPLNSESRLRQFKEKIEKISEQNDINAKLYDEFKAKNRSSSHYNYLTKRYSISKEINRTLPDEKEYFNFRNDNFDDYNKSIDPNFYNKKELFNFEGNKRDGTDITNKYFYDKYFNPTYQTYKEVNKDYEDYNRNIINQNIRFKEEMLDRKKFEEEERKKEREKLISLQQLQKF